MSEISKKAKKEVTPQEDVSSSSDMSCGVFNEDASFTVEDKNNNSPLRATMKIVLAALFAALLTVSDAYLAIRLPDGEINFNLVISFFAGAVLGGPLGFVVGVLGDFLGWVLFVDGAYNPFCAAASGLVCFVPGLLFSLNKKRAEKGKRSINVIIVTLVCYVVCFLFFTILLKSFGLWIYTSSLQSKYTLIAYFIRRITIQSLNTAANFALSLALIVPLRKIKYFKRIL